MIIAEELFRAAHHLTAPWKSSSIKFEEGERILDIWVDFPKGSRFSCLGFNHLDCEFHDATTRSWRHLDFFEHQTFLHGRVPRIKCPNCGIRQVKIPWARERSGFTPLMDALIVFFAQTMQISQISEKLDIKDKRIWRVISYYVAQALSEADFSKITSVGLDEASRRKGHQYITVFANIDTGRIIQICKGKDASALSSFSDTLEKHNSNAEKIEDFCCDMSPAFIKGIKEQFPLTSIIFDKFHVLKMVNEAVDEVRRIEQMFNRVLKKYSVHLAKKTIFIDKNTIEGFGGIEGNEFADCSSI
ncbi:ISL3 family transposase [uncultured Methanospirillum sp.]|uniref:ISL3 family transposase n=1 Tax=uncultured Methanospirillum sp. TaxID=262503 RepID=UPI0029C92A85|nr:ISL3 family transposase [uncultured Methanospirillum sp.]